MSTAYFRTIPSGQTQVAPLPAVAISGLASWDGKSLKITGFNRRQIGRIKAFDGLYIDGQLAIVGGLPSNKLAEVVTIPLFPSRKFGASFTDEPVMWAKGVQWGEYPNPFHIFGDDFEVSGVSYNAAISFVEPIFPVLVTANDDTNIGSGILVDGSTIVTQNFANTNLQFLANRAHDLNGFSAIIREPGVHSLQLGADVPTGMIPLPNIKFSGFTGSNAADSVMTLNGSLKGVPGTSDVYIPIAIVTQGDPFGEGGGKLLSAGLYVEPNGLGGFNLYAEQVYVDNILGIDITKLFQSGDYYVIDAADEDKVKWKLGKDGSLTHDGALGNTSAVELTTGGNWQIPDNVSLAVYNPAILQAAATISLPVNPIEGHLLDLLVGGTITSGAVVTALTLSGGLNAIIGSVPTTLNAGLIRLRFTNGKWYIN